MVQDIVDVIPKSYRHPPVVSTASLRPNGAVVRRSPDSAGSERTLTQGNSGAIVGQERGKSKA